MESVQLEPNASYSKYMYLGQLSVEKEAINNFQKGVDLMVKGRNGLSANSDEAKILASKISSALCSMTEIYLTDCWYDIKTPLKIM